MPSDLESGSEREHILSVFHNHPSLSLPGEQIDLDELLLDNPSYFIYEIDRGVRHVSSKEGVGQEEYSTEGAIEVNLSKQYTSENEILLEALITIEGILTGEYLEEIYADIVSSNTVGYIEDNEGNYSDCLAVIRIPENFDQNRLERTVEAATNILHNAIRLQRNIMHPASRFKPE
jgi:hypothetical protein